MRWKRWMRWKKNNSPHFTAFLTKIHREIHRISYKNSPQMISKVYSIWFKFTRKFNDVRESWRSELSSGKSCRRAEVRTRVRTTLFCKNTENAVKINNSPRFTAFTAKRCKTYAVKIIFFFHRISPHFLRNFTAKPRPGCYIMLGRQYANIKTSSLQKIIKGPFFTFRSATSLCWL